MIGLGFEEGIAGAARAMAYMSWVLIPIAGIAWLTVAVVMEERSKRHRRELLHRERMAAIEKGMTAELERAILAETQPAKRPKNGGGGRGLLVAGAIVCVTALGMLFGIWILTGQQEAAKNTWAAGVFPLFIGLGLIVGWLVGRGRNGSSANGSQDPAGRGGYGR
jgi:hypothetical protein